MRKTKNFNIQVPELGDVPDITQVSNAIQDLEDALAGTLEIVDASIQGSGLTLRSVARQTKRTKYYDGMSMRFLCPQTISANALKTVVVDDLPQQVITVPFDIIAGEYVDITYSGTSFTAHPVMIQKSESIDSNSNETVATSKAVKKINDKVNTVSNEVNELDKNKENAFSKKSGFNLDKTDNVTNDTNKLFTAKGAYNLKNEVDTRVNTVSNKVSELNKNKVSKNGDIMTGTLTLDNNIGNHIVLKRSGELKGSLTSNQDGITLYNEKSKNMIELRDNGDVVIPANNLNSHDKDIVKALNKNNGQWIKIQGVEDLNLIKDNGWLLSNPSTSNAPINTYGMVNTFCEGGTYYENQAIHQFYFQTLSSGIIYHRKIGNNWVRMANENDTNKLKNEIKEVIESINKLATNYKLAAIGRTEDLLAKKSILVPKNAKKMLISVNNKAENASFTSKISYEGSIITGVKELIVETHAEMKIVFNGSDDKFFYYMLELVAADGKDNGISVWYSY